MHSLHHHGAPSGDLPCHRSERDSKALIEVRA
jgi:hypothetical protein